MRILFAQAWRQRYRTGAEAGAYRIDIADDRTVKVDMSLTSPNCPSAQELPVMVLNAVSTVPGVGKVDVSVVWDPPWDPSRMSEEARVVLNML